MDAVSIALITISLLVGLILLGVHIAVSMCVVSVLAIWLATGKFEISISILSTTAYNAIKDYTFGVIPLFVLMGYLTNLSGASSEIFNAFNVLLRKIRGGLGMAVVGSNAVFACITGVSVASAAVFSKVALEPMTQLKYKKKFTLGTIAGSSVLGMLIPPSVLLIVYGMLASQSIGRLFMAGVIPGLVLSAVYCIGIYLMGRLMPSQVGGEVVKDARWTMDDLKTLVRPWSYIVLIAVSLGGIYLGWFTPVEAGAVGVLGAFLIALAKRQVTWAKLKDVLFETGYTSASILLLLIAAQMYSRAMSVSGILGVINNFINSLEIPPLGMIFVFIFVIILLGMILDSTSILLITVPLMLPYVTAGGFDLIWFGIIIVIAVEMGLLTPPFGLVIFAIKSSINDDTVRIEDLFSGAIPFVIMMFITLVILVFVPQLSTWLPSMMLK